MAQAGASPLKASTAVIAAIGVLAFGCDQKPKAPAAPIAAAAAPNAEAPAAPHPDMAAGPEAARPPATLTQVKAVMADCTDGAADLGVMSAEAAEIGRASCRERVCELV